MKRIPLTRGQFAIVDDADYDYLMLWKWYALASKIGFYAVRYTGGTKGEAVLMHREILGLNKGDGKYTDHKNHNTLDNQRYNLRVCTCRENLRNRKPNKNTSSQFKGVYRCRNRWEAGIRNYGRRIYLGKFISEIEAAKTYDAKAKDLFGKFAYLNFPLVAS